MVPLLESICGIPVVIEISNHPDVKQQIFSSSIEKLYRHYDEQRRWENSINKQTSEILKDYNPVLKSIFPRLQVKFIGIEMLKWTDTQQNHFQLSLGFCQEFIKSSLFTSKGFIDEEKAARGLVEEPSLSLSIKFKIACHFCFEDIIPNLWQELQDNEPDFKKIPSKLYSKTLGMLWSDYLEERKSTSAENQLSITSKFKAKVFTLAIKMKNVAAVKFGLGPEGEFRKSRKKIDSQETLLHKSFKNSVEWLNCFLFKPSLDQLLSQKIALHYKFVEYIVSTMNVKTLLFKYNLTLAILPCFLHWPYQYQFMKIAQISFDNIDKNQYYSQLDLIISFIQRENVNSSYNYRLLLRDFWIKSPAPFKEYVIDMESGEYPAAPDRVRVCNNLLTIRHNYNLHLIEQLFHIKQFTSDDKQNVYLIVKDASSVNKEKIFQIQGKSICGHLCSLGNYKTANFFFNVLKLNQDKVKAFKKDFAFDFFLCIIKKKSTKYISDEFFKWVLGNDEIDELKNEIFQSLTNGNKIEILFEYFPEKNRFSLVDKTLKLFLKTDERIEEWKKHIFLNVVTACSPLIQYNNPDWIVYLLEYLGTSNDNSNIKRKIFLGNLPEIAKSIL